VAASANWATPARVPGTGIEPALDHVVSFGFTFSFAPFGAPLRSHRGIHDGYPKR